MSELMCCNEYLTFIIRIIKRHWPDLTAIFFTKKFNWIGESYCRVQFYYNIIYLIEQVFVGITLTVCSRSMLLEAVFCTSPMISIRFESVDIAQAHSLINATNISNFCSYFHCLLFSLLEINFYGLSTYC